MYHKKTGVATTFSRLKGRNFILGKTRFQKLGKILKNFGKFLKKLGKFFKKFTKFLRFAEAKLKSREVLKAKLGSKAKPCYTLHFFEYKIKCAMLKNAMFFILAVLSLSGCTNYSRPEKIALQKSGSPYPPPIAKDTQTETFVAQNSNRIVADASENFWLRFEISPAQEKTILDLGTELVDEARLFVPESGEWLLYDKTGKTVPHSQKRVQGIRCALEIPAEQSEFLLQIKNSDPTALNLRLFSQRDFFLQTMKLNFLHGMSMALFLISICAQIIIWVFRKNKNSPFILATTIFFFIYQLCMKGIAPAFFWNQFAQGKFFLHITYIVAAFGFATILALTLKCIRTESHFAIRKQVNAALIGFALLFAIMFSISPNFDFVYRLSICVLIAGLLFETIVIAHGIKNHSADFSILAPWCVFYIFLIFRQTFHLVRKSRGHFLLSAIFENDYYFSYDVAFLAVNVAYFFILIRSLKRRVANQRDEKREAKRASVPQENAPRTLEEILFECGLSPREIEVAQMLYSRQSSRKEISSKLNISMNTVATHIKHIFEKCGVNSRISFYKFVNEKITQKSDNYPPPIT